MFAEGVGPLLTGEWIQTVLTGAPALALAAWLLILLSSAWRAALWADVGDDIGKLATRWQVRPVPVAFGWRVRTGDRVVTWRLWFGGPRTVGRFGGAKRTWPRAATLADLDQGSDSMTGSL